MNGQGWSLFLYSQSSLYIYVHEALNIIVGSSLVCPPILRDVFCTLKSQAILKYPSVYWFV